MWIRRLSSFSLSLLLVVIIGAYLDTRAEVSASNPPPTTTPEAWQSTGVTQASLHNPGFDNHIWYEFNDRYGNWYAQSWVPDDDVPNGPQDWRLWYMRGQPLIQSFPESAIIQGGVESVALRIYDGSIQHGGLYQIIYNTTPCVFYNFQIYGRSQPDPGQTPPATLKAGIDQVGWHPNPSVDPAVPGAFPSTTIWGTAHDYKRTFGPVSVTAEALNNTITVFAYAYASGGKRHAIVWDSASLQTKTPSLLHDPQNLPDPGGVFDVAFTAGYGAAQIRWQTSANTLGQVYYHLVPESPTPTPPPTIYTLRTYLPLIRGQNTIEWSNFSDVSQFATTSHVINLTNLLRGRSYNFIAVSRGASDGGCTTWVSTVHTFTTLE
jgi:hypothetical protein